MGFAAPLLQAFACSLVVAPMVKIAGSSGIFDILREDVVATRHYWIDRLEEACSRNLQIVQEHCSCSHCRMHLARIYGRERGLDTAINMALWFNATVIHRVSALLISEELSHEQVGSSVDRILRSIPWNDLLVHRRALMDMRCFVESDDPGDNQHPASRFD